MNFLKMSFSIKIIGDLMEANFIKFLQHKNFAIYFHIFWLHNEFKHSNKSNPFIRGQQKVHFHLIRCAYQVIGDQSV
jgi:hypothetical protein